MSMNGFSETPENTDQISIYRIHRSMVHVAAFSQNYFGIAGYSVRYIMVWKIYVLHFSY